LIAGAPNNIGYRKNMINSISAVPAITIEKQDPDLLEVSSTGNYSYRLFDLNGRLLKQGVLKTGYNRIATTAVSEGVYVLQWLGESTSGSKKIIQE
jgi:hypothetical protein